MPRRDLIRIFIIGAAVGILVQPILANTVPERYSAILALGPRLGIFFFFLIVAPLALWIAKLISRWMPSIYQFAQFAAVGTLNSFIDLGVLNLETYAWGTSLISNGLFAAFKAVSFLCATTNSFLWNKHWTFDSKDQAGAKQVTGFYAVAVVGWVLNVGAATAVKAAGPAGSVTWVNLIAPIGGIAASFLWDFFGYKYLVFKKK